MEFAACRPRRLVEIFKRRWSAGQRAAREDGAGAQDRCARQRVARPAPGTLELGLVRRRFVPPAAQGELRDLVRYRKWLIGIGSVNPVADPSASPA